jgi:hypothetical protein
MILDMFRKSMSRHGKDPRVLKKGPSSLRPADRVAKALGWFSIALGIAELVAPRRIANSIGMRRAAPLLRAYGVREIASGIGALSVNPKPAMWSRVGGDAIDLATLAVGLRRARWARRRNLTIAIGVVAAVAVVDLLVTEKLHHDHDRHGKPRDYSDRSGFPKSPEAMRGAAGGFDVPRDMRAALPQPRSSLTDQYRG